MLTSPATTRRVELPKPHPAQVRVLREAKRFNVLCMGRRWGKTTLGVRLLKRTIKARQPAGWFAPTYKLLDEAWREVKRRYAPIIERTDAVAKRIEFVGGASIDFWTLRDADPARGRKYALVVIDEAAIVPDLEERWQASIRPTLTDYQGRAWFLSTPKGKNYFYHLFHQAAEADGWARWQMPTTSNPHIHPKEVEHARLELPELVFRQEYLAEFVDLEGAQVRREWIHVAEPPPRESLRVYQGVDLAISTSDDADYTAIVTLGVDKDGRRWVLDVVRARVTFHAALKLIQSQAARWKPIAIAIEQVQYQAAVVQELLRTTNLPVRGVRPDRDKLARAMPVLARYEQGLIWHSPQLPREFEEELLAFPIGEHDDQVDALVYAFVASGSYAASEDVEEVIGW